MNLDTLLALFSAFERNGVDYVVAGDLAALMRGQLALAEGLEIAVADTEGARSVIVNTWPSAEITDLVSVMRVLLPSTPFYMDVVARSVATVDLLVVRGITVRVAGVDDQSELRDDWSRPGFTLRERLAALHALTRELVPPHMLVGVRKYRSIEQANAERERWDAERVDRIRAERARK